MDACGGIRHITSVHYGKRPHHHTKCKNHILPKSRQPALEMSSVAINLSIIVKVIILAQQNCHSSIFTYLGYTNVNAFWYSYEMQSKCEMYIQSRLQSLQNAHGRMFCLQNIARITDAFFNIFVHPALSKQNIVHLDSL